MLSVEKYPHTVRKVFNVTAHGDGHARTIVLQASLHTPQFSMVAEGQPHDEVGSTRSDVAIVNLLQSGSLHRALVLYSSPPSTPLSGHILIALLKTCSRLMDLNMGQLIHAEIVAKGFDADVFVGSTLVDMYAKCGRCQEAHMVLGKLSARNVVSWNALATGYAQHGLCEEVLKCLNEMQLDGFSVNAISMTCALKACGNIEDTVLGFKIHSEIFMKGLERDTFLGSSLVDMYGKCGLVVESKTVFDKLEIRDTVSWTALIAGYAEHGPEEAAILSFRQMKRESIQPDSTTFICILKACGHASTVSEGYEVHTEIVKKGFELDFFVGSTLVDMYAKCRLFLEALSLLMMRPTDNIVSWNAIMAAYADHGASQEAWDCIYQMHLQGIAPNSATYTSILKALGYSQAVDAGYKTHAEVVQKGLEGETCVGNSLVDFYAKCECVLEANSVFIRLPFRDIVSWTALITGFSEYGQDLEALKCFERLRVESIVPDLAMFASVLKACGSLGNVEIGMNLHREAVERGFEHDLLVSNTLVDMYAKCGFLVEAQKTFDSLSIKSVVSWTSLIGGYADIGLGKEAIKCYDQMQMEGTNLDSAIFMGALKACASAATLDHGHKVHTEVVRRGYESHLTIASMVVDMYAKCGAVADALVAFECLHVRAVITWNALLTGLVDNEYYDEALSCFEEMQEKHVLPDMITFVSILKACSGLGDLCRGHEIATEILRRGFEIDPYVGNTLVNLFAKCESLLEALQIFNRLPDQSVISWNVIISGYVDCGPSHEALDYFERVKKTGLSEATVTYICGLKACGNAAAIAKGHAIHKEITLKGLERGTSIGSTLVDMYVKCGVLVDAENVFHVASIPDAVAWNAMIKGYGLNHDGERALWFFERMLEHGIQPNPVTFLGLLTACSHTDLVSKGEHYFGMMQEKYKITPHLDHFSCMIDLHSRSGNLFKAEEFLNSLPCSPSKHLWLPLLTACKVHADVELGAICFEKLVKMVPACATSYMLMATIYAHAGKWDEVIRIEEMRKNAGASSVCCRIP